MDGPQGSAAHHQIVEQLELVPLPVEGGFFRQTHRDGWSTAIYYLITPRDFSAMHRLDGPEMWHWYAGAPVTMLLLDPGGTWRRPVLGADLSSGQRPQILVEAGVAMGAYPEGPWSLLGTTMAPPYDEDGVEFPDAAELVDGWPDASDHIRRLVR